MLSGNWTKGKWHWEGEIQDDDNGIKDEDKFLRNTADTWLSDENGEVVLVPWDYEGYSCGLFISEANARLIAAAPDLLVVSHNLAETMAIDYAIKKLGTLSDDIMALGAATILKGIQRQAKEAIKKAEVEK